MGKIWFGKRILLLASLTVLLAACDQIQTTQKYTLKGTSTKTPFQIQHTYTPTKEPAPTHTPSRTPTITPTITDSPEPSETLAFTDTATPETITLTSSPQPTNAPTKKSEPEKSEKATVRVSLTTNCRTGPGLAYAKLTPLYAGKTATLIGRDKSYSYWIIKDPGNTGRDCWLWGYYATTSGNTQNLPIYSPPQQPTQKASSTPYPTKPTTPPASKTPRPSATPKTPLPTNTPNLTPATSTYTPLPPTQTPVPSETPLPSNTPLPSSTPLPSNTPPAKFCAYTSALPGEEQQIMDLINKARRNHGLAELTLNSKLQTAAREHGQDMTCNGIYSHTSSDGTLAWQRIGLAVKGNSNWCYSNCCCGEIFYGGGSYLTPAQAFDWWMHHPSADPNYTDNIHKRTILGQYYNRLGVGVIYYEHNGVIRKFYTVDFIRR
jgi:uncharacterized protein YkwD